VSVWRAFRRGFRALLRSGAATRDVDEEVRYYLDEEAAELRAQGLSADAARRETRLRYGDAAGIREQVQFSGWEHVMSTIAADVRFGARRLRRTPGFTLTAAFILALGIGASTSIFSVIYPVLFAPLPYPGGERVAVLLENGRSTVGTYAMYRALLAGSNALDSAAVIRRWQPAITGIDMPERLEGQRVSAAYFSVLGVRPALGTGFTGAHERAGASDVVVLSDGLWRRRFGSDPAIVGRAIRLDGRPYTVLGVMPAFDNVLAPAASVWSPVHYDPALPADGPEWGHHLVTVVRLKPRVTLAAASEEANRVGRAMLAARRPVTYDPNTRFSIAPLRTELVRGVRPVLLAIGGAVGLVLLIACANVTSLLFARGVRRAGETAMRVALGASRLRIAAGALTETLLLAVLGGAGGVAIAVLGTRALRAIGPAGMARLDDVHIDARALGFATVLTVLVGLIAGLIPTLVSSGARLQVQESSVRTARRQGRTLPALVAAEVALALVLLIGAGLLLRSVRELLAVPVGFEPRGLLTLQVQAVGPGYSESAASVRFFDQALDAVRRVPGVTAAAATSQLPLSGDRDEYGAGFPAAQGLPAVTIPVFRYGVSADYFSTAGIPITRGRAINERDTAASPPVAVISEALAVERFRDRDPIGQSVRVGPAGPFTIVGVAGNVRQVSLAVSDADAVYLSPAQWPFSEGAMSFVVRAHGSPGALAEAVRQAVWSIDRDAPVARIAAMDDLLEASESERRFTLLVFEAFAMAALVLAAVGLYGVLAGNVSARLREIGVRSALGATRSQLVGMVVRQGLTLTAFGVVIGLIGAAFASRLLAGLLFGISRLDPWTYATVVALLIGVSLIAASLPAWRAARVDPSTTLRAE
jgi:putative ABC transport system permease protein